MTRSFTGSVVRNLVRVLTPRFARNLARNPRATISWLRQEAAFSLGNKPVCKLHDDWTITCHPASFDAFSTYSDSEDYRGELNSFIQRCGNGMQFLDIGSHFGIFTLAALRFGGKDARVVAVEPSKTCCRILRTNLSLNGGIGDRVTILNIAVGDHDGEVPMLTTGPSGLHFLLVTDEPHPDARFVREKTIPTICSEAGLTPTHVKIDVEGFEKEVIDGGRSFLREHHPIIFLELHGSILRTRGMNPSLILEDLSEMGYTSFRLTGMKGEGSALFSEALNAAAVNEVTRIVCSPASRG